MKKFPYLPIFDYSIWKDLDYDITTFGESWLYQIYINEFRSSIEYCKTSMVYCGVRSSIYLS